MLFVQDDIADRVIAMLAGAMAELQVGDPALLSTDVGPVIDERRLRRCCGTRARMQREAKLIARRRSMRRTARPLLRAGRLRDRRRALTSEVFGPVLHVVR